MEIAMSQTSNNALSNETFSHPAAPGGEIPRSAAPKTFRAQDTLAALEEVQRELGPEAIIVSVRQVPVGPAWQVWRRPGVEVMAISAPRVPKVENTAARLPTLEPPAVAEQARAGFATPSRPATQPARPPHRTREEMETMLLELAARLEKTRSTAAEAPKDRPAGSAQAQPPVEHSDRPPVERSDRPLAHAPRQPSWPPILEAAWRRLVDQGVECSLVEKVIHTSAEAMQSGALKDKIRVHNFIKRQLEACLIPSPAHIGRGRRVVFLVGNSGAGKTSACAKIAAYHLQNQHEKVAWICADTVRTGAIAKARAYAEPLGLPLRLAYTPQDLSEAVAAEGGADLILVDTPACNTRLESEVIELGSFLTEISRRWIYLAAPASQKESDLGQALSALGPFHIDGLVATKLDEASTFGSLFNVAWRSRLPLIYFSTGTGLLDNLAPARAAGLVDRLWGGR
jgi:flagellar biosynthesis protein FlhF